jgi:hypothetical protein
VSIGGFIITGHVSKKVIIRALGPSLTRFGISGVLADPVLELHQANVVPPIGFNDNWKDSQEAEIQATGIPPSNDKESAIIKILSPGSYTAIVRGKNNGTGIGLVEVYDLNQGADSQLGNISTRGFVGTGQNVMIGGIIVGKSGKILVRAIGPSLGNAGIQNPLQDPTLDLRNGNGDPIAFNDNWKDQPADQRAAIQATGIPPSNDKESAILRTFSPGNFTAIVRGKNNRVGVGLVEFYQVQ